MNFPDFENLIHHSAPRLASMGLLMQTLRIFPGQLKVLMEDGGIKFAQVVDGVGYVTVADAEKIATMVRDIYKEIHDVQESAKYN